MSEYDEKLKLRLCFPLKAFFCTETTENIQYQGNKYHSINSMLYVCMFILYSFFI